MIHFFVLKLGISFWHFIGKQVRRYRIRIKKFMNAYSGKIVKIIRYGLLSRDILGLGKPYSTKKRSCLKKILIYTISLVLRPGNAPDRSSLRRF